MSSTDLICTGKKTISASKNQLKIILSGRYAIHSQLMSILLRKRYIRILEMHTTFRTKFAHLYLQEMQLHPPLRFLSQARFYLSTSWLHMLFPRLLIFSLTSAFAYLLSLLYFRQYAVRSLTYPTYAPQISTCIYL